MIRQRLKKGTNLSFQDPVIDDHLSGPAMILEFPRETGRSFEKKTPVDLFQWFFEVCHIFKANIFNHIKRICKSCYQGTSSHPVSSQKADEKSEQMEPK